LPRKLPLKVVADPSCPCGLPRSYPDCCGRLHAGAPAPDAEALMRSRYSAFALGKADYLRNTWHPDTRPAQIELEPLGERRWLGLQVKHHGVLDADHATVEFVARSRLGGGSAQRQHERSRFIRIAGCWLYVDGEALG
jgi:SEC-C motif-containing protein